MNVMRKIFCVLLLVLAAPPALFGIVAFFVIPLDAETVGTASFLLAYAILLALAAELSWPKEDDTSLVSRMPPRAPLTLPDRHTPEGTADGGGPAQDVITSSLSALSHGQESAPNGNVLDLETIEKFADIAEEILADNRVTFREAVRLLTYFEFFPDAAGALRTYRLYDSCLVAVADDYLDEDEAEELRVLLSEYCDSARGVGTSLAVAVAVAKPRATPPKEAPVDPPKAGDRFEITYEDADGVQTERRINFRKCTSKGDRHYVYAVCLERKALRTFRSDRILDAVALETGEWIHDPETYFRPR